MKTPDEIKKGLECCTDICDEGCHICVYNKPYNRRDKQCLVQLKVDALAYIQQLERERDAAVADLEKMGNARPYCGTCMYVDLTTEEEPCVNCHEGYFENHWQWRGVQEVE